LNIKHGYVPQVESLQGYQDYRAKFKNFETVGILNAISSLSLGGDEWGAKETKGIAVMVGCVRPPKPCFLTVLVWFGSPQLRWL
jgi:hypothetical protein